MMHDDHQESESATPALSNQVAVMARLRHIVFEGQEPIVVALKKVVGARVRLISGNKW